MDLVDVTYSTPSKILIRSGRKTATIYGEALAKLPGQPDFIIFLNSLKHWCEGENILEISLVERNKIVCEVVDQLSKRGWKIEVE